MLYKESLGMVKKVKTMNSEDKLDKLFRDNTSGKPSNFALAFICKIVYYMALTLLTQGMFDDGDVDFMIKLSKEE